MISTGRLQVAREIEKIVPNSLAATDWMEQNKPILTALKTERMVTLITISLIQIDCRSQYSDCSRYGRNGKGQGHCDPVDMGARHQQIRNVFVLQGVIIGVVGSAIGLTLGYTLSYFADRYQWIHLEEQVYSISYSAI